MKGFRQRGDRLEAALRAQRPEPPDPLLAAIQARLRQERPRWRVPRRPALAVALSVALLASFGAFGGLGYAASAAKKVTTVTRVATVVAAVATPTPTPGPASTPAATTDSTPAAASTPADASIATAPAASSVNVAASQQYRPGKGCGDPNHVHLRENECKKPPR